MTEKLRVFVSSVQKELEDERLIIQNLLVTDAFLSVHCSPVLYELEPASPTSALEGCIEALDTCQVYLLIVGIEYGTRIDDLSITHAEYRRAKHLGLPVLAFIKGGRGVEREAGTRDLLDELDADGPKYKRFGNVIEIQREVRAALVRLLRDDHGISPTSDEDEIAGQTIEATSAFESQPLERVRWQDLDHEVIRRLLAAAETREPTSFSEAELLAGATLRGLVWRPPGGHWIPEPGHGDGLEDHKQPDEHFATAAGIVMAARDPSAVFPHCRILADAYRGAEPDGEPSDHEDVRAPMPLAVERAIAFVDRNTRHPMRIVGLNRVRIDEYPAEALREAVVNAVAHRQYEDAGRKILLEVYSDRVVISSPGLPPAPITIASLRRGTYRPCSRNPVLAQCLSYFHRIEERGSGIRRMIDQMVAHGLDRPLIGANTGYMQITFVGPGEDIERIQVPESRLKVIPTIAAQLSERQRKIMAYSLENGSVTTGWCMKTLDIVRDTAHRDLVALVELGLLVRTGAGRATRYVPTDERGT